MCRPGTSQKPLSGRWSETHLLVGLSLLLGLSSSLLATEEQPSTVTGVVYCDANENGTLDTSENGLAGVAVLFDVVELTASVEQPADDGDGRHDGPADEHGRTEDQAGGEEEQTHGGQQRPGGWAGQVHAIRWRQRPAGDLGAG